jgi:hypothetical protein
MKSIVKNLGSPSNNIVGKDGVDASTDADKLEAAFKQVEEFWKKRGSADDGGAGAVEGFWIYWLAPQRFWEEG